MYQLTTKHVGDTLDCFDNQFDCTRLFLTCLVLKFCSCPKNVCIVCQHKPDMTTVGPKSVIFIKEDQSCNLNIPKIRCGAWGRPQGGLGERGG